MVKLQKYGMECGMLGDFDMAWKRKKKIEVIKFGWGSERWEEIIEIETEEEKEEMEV